MTDLRTAAQQALETLEWHLSRGAWGADIEGVTEALRAALAEPVQKPVAWLRVIDEAMVTHHLGVADPADDYETAKRKMNNLLCTAQDIGTFFAKTEPEQEPVAWMTHENNRLPLFHKTEAGALAWGAEPLPLYTTPPQRKQDAEWRELDGAVGPLFKRVLRKFARAIEQAHGITTNERK